VKLPAQVRGFPAIKTDIGNKCSVDDLLTKQDKNGKSGKKICIFAKNMLIN